MDELKELHEMNGMEETQKINQLKAVHEVNESSRATVKEVKQRTVWRRGGGRRGCEPVLSSVAGQIALKLI